MNAPQHIQPSSWATTTERETATIYCDRCKAETSHTETRPGSGCFECNDCRAIDNKTRDV